jgi:predicted nuclease of restriction endonuclease-like RecB superfamily
MEIIGFWRKDYLQHRIRQCPKNMLLAVSRKLVSDKKKIPKSISDQIIEFAEIIPAKTVLKKLESFT